MLLFELLLMRFSILDFVLGLMVISLRLVVLGLDLMMLSPVLFLIGGFFGRIFPSCDSGWLLVRSSRRALDFWVLGRRLSIFLWSIPNWWFWTDNRFHVFLGLVLFVLVFMLFCLMLILFVLVFLGPGFWHSLHWFFIGWLARDGSFWLGLWNFLVFRFLIGRG